MTPSRWSSDPSVPRGDDYDRRFRAMEAAGESVHGEADFVMALGPESVLDAGCGTGRVGIELARRGVDVVGVDLDDGMLDAARRNAPDIEWVTNDLCTLDLDRTFDVVVMAGNVMIFVEPGTEAAVVQRMAAHVTPGGALVAGFQLHDGGYPLASYDEACRETGLHFAARHATWKQDPYKGGPYAVSTHTRTISTA